MKSFQKQYESKTHLMVCISAALIVLGVFIFFMWSGIGVVPVLAGIAGLIWCFLRR